MLTAYEGQCCNMSFKVNFLHSHLDYFPESFCFYSDEQGERFHQDNGKRYLDVHVMADYLWMLKCKNMVTESSKWFRRSKIVLKSFDKNMYLMEKMKPIIIIIRFGTLTNIVLTKKPQAAFLNYFPVLCN